MFEKILKPNKYFFLWPESAPRDPIDFRVLVIDKIGQNKLNSI